jgi:Periplasmic binding proteins and sugar binding domain of LacI family
MLGMVVPDNRNLYFAELARSIEDACFERGYNLVLCNSDEDPAKENAYLSLLAEKRVDGIVFDRTSHPMAAEIDDVDVTFAAGCLDTRNVFVSPAPEFDMSKAGGGDTRNFIFGQKAGIQRV